MGSVCSRCEDRSKEQQHDARGYDFPEGVSYPDRYNGEDVKYMVALQSFRSSYASDLHQPGTLASMLASKEDFGVSFQDRRGTPLEPSFHLGPCNAHEDYSQHIFSMPGLKPKPFGAPGIQGTGSATQDEVQKYGRSGPTKGSHYHTGSSSDCSNTNNNVSSISGAFLKPYGNSQGGTKHGAKHGTSKKMVTSDSNRIVIHPTEKEKEQEFRYYQENAKDFHYHGELEGNDYRNYESERSDGEIASNPGFASNPLDYPGYGNSTVNGCHSGHHGTSSQVVNSGNETPGCPNTGFHTPNYTGPTHTYAGFTTNPSESTTPGVPKPYKAYNLGIPDGNIPDVSTGIPVIRSGNQTVRPPTSSRPPKGPSSITLEGKDSSEFVIPWNQVPSRHQMESPLNHLSSSGHQIMESPSKLSPTNSTGGGRTIPGNPPSTYSPNKNLIGAPSPYEMGGSLYRNVGRPSPVRNPGFVNSSKQPLASNPSSTKTSGVSGVSSIAKAGPTSAGKKRMMSSLRSKVKR